MPHLPRQRSPAQFNGIWPGDRRERYFEQPVRSCSDPVGAHDETRGCFLGHGGSQPIQPSGIHFAACVGACDDRIDGCSDAVIAACANGARVDFEQANTLVSFAPSSDRLTRSIHRTGVHEHELVALSQLDEERSNKAI